MIFNMVGGGAGGAGGASIFAINSVNQRPANVFNNTLWVNTDVDVVKYVFSANEPSNPTEGMLWLTISNSDNVNVTAPINKDWMEFNLGIVKQYIDGVWERKIAQLYKDGIWVDVSKTFSATISITYPATSTCVVTNSSGQTVASDTNTGSSTKTWTATVNATGTYTVTANATDGSGNTKSESVEITSDGQSVNVELSYIYYLYNTGREFIAITGGWKARKQGSGGTFTKKETSIYINGTPANGMNAATANKIDLTPFTTAKIRLKKVSNVNNTGRFFFSTYSEYIESGSAPLDLPAVSEPELVSLDITSLTGLYYAVFLSLNNCEIEFDQVWLE